MLLERAEGCSFFRFGTVMDVFVASTLYTIRSRLMIGLPEAQLRDSAIPFIQDDWESASIGGPND